MRHRPLRHNRPLKTERATEMEAKPAAARIGVLQLDISNGFSTA
jgi:hypothetical protein